MIKKIKNFKDIILSENKTIHEAILILQKKALQILLIQNKNNDSSSTFPQTF